MPGREYLALSGNEEVLLPACGVCSQAARLGEFTKS